MADGAGPAGRRPNQGGGHGPVSYLELFVDLVYVFAIPQLGHVLHEDLSWHGLLAETVLFLAVWWAWGDWRTPWALAGWTREEGGASLRSRSHTPA